MIDPAYRAEMLAMRRKVYAGLPDGIAIMAAVDAQSPHPDRRPIALSPAEAVIESYCAARASSVAGRGASRASTLDNMRAQLRRNGIKPLR